MILIVFWGFCFWGLILDFDEQVVSGIALPSDSNSLYTGSKDETVRVWDCTTGQVVVCFFYLFIWGLIIYIFLIKFVFGCWEFIGREGKSII